MSVQSALKDCVLREKNMVNDAEQSQQTRKLKDSIAFAVQQLQSEAGNRYTVVHTASGSGSA